MFEVFYTTRETQITCDVLRMRARDNETAEDRIARAKAAVRKAGGKDAKFHYIGW